MRPQPLSATYNSADNRGAMPRRRKQRCVVGAALLLVICLDLIAVGVCDDLQVDCKTKVLAAVHQHCATEGARAKRDALQPRGPNPATGNPGARFKQPVSGDDLSAGLLSPEEIDELVTELYGRRPRAAQSKAELKNMLMKLAASCCTVNMTDECKSNVASLVTCP